MPPQIHPVVQDPTDLDDLRAADTVKQQLPSGSTKSRDMERAHARQDIIPPLEPGGSGPLANSAIACSKVSRYTRA